MDQPDVEALEAAAFAANGNDTLEGLYEDTTAAFLGMSPMEREAIVQDLEARAISFDVPEQYTAINRLGAIVAAEGVDSGIKEHALRILDFLLSDSFVRTRVLLAFVAIGTSEHVDISVKQRIVDILERQDLGANSIRDDDNYFSAALHDIAVDENTAPELRAGIMEFFYGRLEVAEYQDFIWYSERLGRMSTLDGIDPQYLERTITAMEAHIGMGHYFAARVLAEIATAEHTNPETLTRIIGIFERAYDGDDSQAALSVIRPLGAIASNPATPQPAMNRIVRLMEGAMHSRDARMRLEGMSALAAVEEDINGPGLTNPGLRSRISGMLIRATNDYDADIRQNAVELLSHNMISALGTAPQDISRIAVALERMLQNSAMQPNESSEVLEALSEIAARYGTPAPLRSRIVERLGSILRDGSYYMQEDAASALANIGESECVEPALKSTVYQTLWAQADNPNPDVREAISEAMRRVNEARSRDRGERAADGEGRAEEKAR